ncbi:MAG: ParB N-terminal domain-containing protein [Candidatus Aminicenantes bacterium]|nr:ParB N-terminal domain-containing protein [Candidatus Aminicenantes bacterium]
MDLKVLNPLNIDLSDERFRVSFLAPAERLVVSLRAVGLVQPPVFVEREGMLVLLAGWKRVSACRRLEWPEMPAWIYAEKDDRRCFRLALFENLAVRELTLLEKAEAAARLLRFGESREALLTECLPRLGFPAHRGTLEVLLRAAAMEPRIKAAADGHIGDLTVLRELVLFSAEEQDALMPFLRSAGRNKQRGILEHLREASRREKRLPLEILGSADIRDILGSPRLSEPQKTDRLRAALKKKRHPSYSRRREEFESLLKRAGWPRRAGIEPSPFFEDDILSVRVRFRTTREFLGLLKDMERAAGRKEFSEALRIGEAGEDDDVSS